MKKPRPKEPLALESLPRSKPPNGIWVKRLSPAMKRRGLWVSVMECEDSGQASRHASNLRARRVIVPKGKWGFAARTINGVHHVFAIYGKTS